MDLLPFFLSHSFTAILSGPEFLDLMPNPQLGGQFAPKFTFVGGDEVQLSATNVHSSTKPTDIDPECSFKPLINRNIPDFGRMHAVLARQLAANKEARKFQQVIIEKSETSCVFVNVFPDIEGADSFLFFAAHCASSTAAPTNSRRYRSYGPRGWCETSNNQKLGDFYSGFLPRAPSCDGSRF